MGLISIKVEEAEKLRVLRSTKSFKGKTVSVAKIAAKINANENRIRFVIDLLIEEKRLIKIPVKNFNQYYKRYYYEVTK